ncbi:hypothetical protein HYDPIDRAFT_175200 [Hydnomerulius pinastri MD-312]|uniref:Uncharacterized protein n=1 Tax=Hydnomerulius pinastri MD-312 TaxID=994086 RepID=A0A0C9WAZ4_9AGAM|nr:hypothetical protein HYDPIDRAFT_175200 [Hydnomerulius pinastri MD-312]
MTVTSVAQANSKTAEFARLFDLFDRVATRRARAIAGNTSEAISADDIAAVPAEFAPVLKNLSTILSIRAQRDEERERRTQAKPCGRPRRNTVAITPSHGDGAPRAQVLEPSEETEEDVESPSFPLEERYPFTFKLMLHKLYELDEWAEKVKSAVEASKSQFKPLAERVQSMVREATGKERVEKRSVTRSRSQSVIAPGAKSKLSPRERATSSAQTEGNRVLKKRCIGRRKSVSGPMATGVWVYDAAISAVEVTGPRPSVEITLSAPKDANSPTENRSRHRSLAGLEGIQARETARRKVKIAVPLLREDND